VLLNFFALSNNDLEELRKLVSLIDSNDIELIFTEQVLDEFHRNRDGKIAEAIRKLDDQKLKHQFPVMCRDYLAYKDLREIGKEYDKKLKSLKNSLIRDAKQSQLKADLLIDDILSRSKICRRTDEIVKLASLRVKLGNPPGKNGSYGDAINWEILLLSADRSTELCVIADDKDYFSTTDTKSPNSFLLREWYESVGTDCLFYRDISSFLRDHFPEVKIPSETELNTAVNQFVSAGDKELARKAIEKMSAMEAFSNANVNYIVDAFLDNESVKEILNEKNVEDFLLSFSYLYSNVVRGDRRIAFDALVKPLEEERDRNFDIPF
ncbi:PIN domain-containing protein, partial [Granulosicoccus sp.]|nr:PIN domain-containing protein [Granulosicoccus sp.]